MRESAGYLCCAAEVIVVDLFYGLEVDHTLQLGLVLVCRGKQTSLFRASSLVFQPPCCNTVVYREIVTGVPGTVIQFYLIGLKKKKKHKTLRSKGNVGEIFLSLNHF